MSGPPDPLPISGGIPGPLVLHGNPYPPVPDYLTGHHPLRGTQEGWLFSAGENLDPINTNPPFRVRIPQGGMGWRLGEGPGGGRFYPPPPIRAWPRAPYRSRISNVCSRGRASKMPLALETVVARSMAL
jgi:hypothetical protein